METIVSLATPPGNSGVAVIRISGGKSKEILQKLIKENFNFNPRQMYLKKVYAGKVVDTCLVVYFKSPFSFTGEDVAEIQLHGGFLLAQTIIDECIKFGAIPASAGEFSKRAFLNGKLSLDQAEGIMDLINAETKLQAELGSKLLNGKLMEVVTNIANNLTDILAEIEAKLDYPEYEYTQTETTNVLTRLNEILQNLNSFLTTSANGLIIKNGVKVAITGAPNVGKSSLLNALTKTNKAIVTDIAGTTRDIVEGEYVYKGVMFRLFDTAGIRDNADKVEQIGIERALKTVEDADIVLKVFDINNNYQVQTNKPTITIANKSDTKTLTNKDITVSAKTGKNLEALKELIFTKTVGTNLDGNQLYLTNARHIDCIKRAINCLNEVVTIFNETSLDIISNLIKQAWHALCEITGQIGDEEIIDKIFAKFCLGK